MPTLAGLTLGTVVDGNSVEILENGKCWDVLIERIGKREGPVHYETFLWKEGKLGKRMAKAFAERAKAGVKVRDHARRKRLEGDRQRRARDDGEGRRPGGHVSTRPSCATSAC